jgi:hypothetical protein
LPDPGCEVELVLSTSFATNCGIHSHVDEEILVEFPDGTKLPSAAIEMSICVSQLWLIRSVRLSWSLASYEVIIGKPWFTRYNPIVDWRRHRLRMTVNGKSVAIDAYLDPLCHGSHSFTRISATQLKKVIQTKGAGILGSFEPDGSGRESG